MLKRARLLPRDADVLGLYLLLSLALLAPLASNDILPWFPDHSNHTAFVVEAKLALDEGQFPLRIAPFANDGLRYPLFQFYSQTPYLIAATLYKFVTPANPWIAIKLTYVIGLCAAAFFAFRLAQLLGFDRVSSALTGVVYITAPYLLINMHARGAFSEAFAQLLLPIIGYASARVILRDRPFDVAWASVAWCLLGTSHLITFLYGTIFFGLFVVGLLAIRELNIKRAALLLLPCILGWGLSAFQWYPAVAVKLNAHGILGDVFTFRWLTPLSGLLSFTSVPPEPAGRHGMTLDLHPAVGATILIGVAGLLYFRTQDRLPQRAIWVCMGLFAVAFVAVWSPVNFWAWLPPQFLVVQFSYRLLTFTTVFGTMLVAYFLWTYRQRYGSSSFLAWLVGILALTHSYLPPTFSSERTPAMIASIPVTTLLPDAYEYGGEVPSVPADAPLVRIKDTRQACRLDGATLKCTFAFDRRVAVQLPMLFYPQLQRVSVDQTPVGYAASLDGTRALTSVVLDPGRHRVFATFAGSRAGNAIAITTIVLLAGTSLWGLTRGRLRLRAPAASPHDAGVESTKDLARS